MSGLRVVAYPRDTNPYQDHLHAALGRRGLEAGYVAAPTPSAAANLLLLPWQLRAARRRGARVLHVHWLYLFDHPLARQAPVVRRAMRWWLSVVLRTARAAGLTVVWTAHNELPHRPIFDDDVAARALLCASSAAVLAHSETAARRLVDRGWVPRNRVAVVPHGPMPLPASATGRAATRGRLGVPRAARLLAFVGRVEAYKGVDDLLREIAALGSSGRRPARVRVLVAGECRDQRLAARLAELADAAGEAVTLRLGRVPDPELADLLAAADTVVLPFRAVTTSGSALLALGAGRPLALPEGVLPDLPGDAVLRYRDVPGLFARLADVSDAELAAMSHAARDWALSWTWDDVARATEAVYAAALTGADIGEEAEAGLSTIVAGGARA